MGALVFAMGLSFVGALGLGALASCVAFFCGSRRKWNHVFVVAFLIGGAFVVLPTTYATIEALTVVKIGLNGEEADAVLLRWQVPKGTATDVCYLQTARFSCFADFQMSEADFLQWMAVRRWTPQRYTTTDESFQTIWSFNGAPEYAGIDVCAVRDWGNSHVTLVLDGHCYHERFVERPEGYLTILYDVPNERAYIIEPN